MKTLTDDAIAQALRPYVSGARRDPHPDGALEISPEFCEQLRAYIRVLLKWNRVVSLTTITDPDEILRFHFGESIFAASSVMFQNGRLADFGTGAGFPGMPLRMAIPSLELTLVESNAKKCAFLAEVTRELGLSRVSIMRSRVEELNAVPGSFDFVAARAFGQFESLLECAKKMLGERGRVVLWLGEKDCKALSANRDWLWEEPKHIPNSERRFILVGSPKS
jgi:16S rRNA (guanine527-N7)-methyltransferase